MSVNESRSTVETCSLSSMSQIGYRETEGTEEVCAGVQKPDGVNTFMSRGLSLCGRGGGGRLSSIPVIAILGAMNLAGSSTFSLTCVLE